MEVRGKRFYRGRRLPRSARQPHKDDENNIPKENDERLSPQKQPISGSKALSDASEGPSIPTAKSPPAPTNPPAPRQSHPKKQPLRKRATSPTSSNARPSIPAPTAAPVAKDSQRNAPQQPPLKPAFPAACPVQNTNSSPGPSGPATLSSGRTAPTAASTPTSAAHVNTNATSSPATSIATHDSASSYYFHPQPGVEPLASLAGYLDQAFASISGAAAATAHAQRLAQEMINMGGLREILQPGRAYNHGNPAHEIYFELLDMVYCQDDISMANHCTATALQAFQSQFLAHPASLGVVCFARLDIHCPVAISLMTRCGLEALDLVYGALRWQQLVLGCPLWTVAAQTRGILTFQGHWIKAFTVESAWNAGQGSYGSSGGGSRTDAEAADSHKMAFVACRPINLGGLPASLVALYLACVWQEANRCHAWHLARNGNIAPWSSVVFDPPTSHWDNPQSHSSYNNYGPRGNAAPSVSATSSGGGAAPVGAKYWKYDLEDLEHWLRVVLAEDSTKELNMSQVLGALVRAAW